MAKQKTKLISKRATQGEKMIEVRISFWTNKIAAKKDEIVPKHAWVVMIRTALNRATRWFFIPCSMLEV